MFLIINTLYTAFKSSFAFKWQDDKLNNFQTGLKLRESMIDRAGTQITATRVSAIQNTLEDQLVAIKALQELPNSEVLAAINVSHQDMQFKYDNAIQKRMDLLQKALDRVKNSLSKVTPLEDHFGPNVDLDLKYFQCAFHETESLLHLYEFSDLHHTNLISFMKILHSMIPHYRLWINHPSLASNLPPNMGFFETCIRCLHFEVRSYDMQHNLVDPSAVSPEFLRRELAVRLGKYEYSNIDYHSLFQKMWLIDMHYQQLDTIELEETREHICWQYFQCCALSTIVLTINAAFVLTVCHYI